MRRPTLQGVRWFVVNLLLLGATIFIALLLYFLFTDDPESAGERVVGALFGSIFYGLLLTVPALPFALAYLLVLRRVARRVSGLRLRAIAVLLGPIAFFSLCFVLENLFPLALAFPYGAIVRLPTPNRLPLPVGDPPSVRDPAGRTGGSPQPRHVPPP